MIVCGSRDASAALWHEGNAEVVVLTESGDTINQIAQDAAHIYGLTSNVGRCTSALIREIHGVSVKTYHKNPKQYDRNFKADQVYVLPDACVTNLKKGVAEKTAAPTTVEVSPAPKAPDAYLAPTQPASPEIPVIQQVAETVPTAGSQFPTNYSIPPLPTPVLDDEGYRTSQLPNIVACANSVTDMEWLPNLPDIVYTTGIEVMRNLARKVCGDERKIASHFQQPNAG